MQAGLPGTAPGVAAAGLMPVHAAVLESAEEALRAGARRLHACAEQLDAHGQDLAAAQASVRWWSPAALAHHDLMTLDLTRLREAAAQCRRLAVVLNSLAGAR